jgi:hypothetical protein
MESIHCFLVKSQSIDILGFARQNLSKNFAIVAEKQIVKNK